MSRILPLVILFLPWLIAGYLIPNFWKERYDPLHDAIRSGDLRNAQTMIEMREFGNLNGNGGYSALQSAITHAFGNRDRSHDSWNDVVFSLLSVGADPNELSFIGRPLHGAAFRNNVDIIEALIKYGAVIDGRECREGLTALMYASKVGNTDSVKVLLELGADYSIKSKSGQAALDLSKNDEIRELILEKMKNTNL